MASPGRQYDASPLLREEAALITTFQASVLTRQLPVPPLTSGLPSTIIPPAASTIAPSPLVLSYRLMEAAPGVAKFGWPVPFLAPGSRRAITKSAITSQPLFPTAELSLSSPWLLLPLVVISTRPCIPLREV